MKNIQLLSLFSFFLFASCDSDDKPTQVPDFEGYTLVWSDEFNDETINRSNWTYETGNGVDFGLPVGWGNDELQLYTDTSSNSYIEKNEEDESFLVIAATEDTPASYRSAKMTTYGLQSFRYGKIDARIKLPTAQGMWPALWLLGDNRSEIDWPGCGEIDILELVGHTPNRVQSNVHYTNFEKRYRDDEGSPIILEENFNTNFHNFSLEWTPTEIYFSLDGNVFKTTLIESDMNEFQRSFYLILNVAVGGNWPGSPDETTAFPQKMYVDYIRYYSKDGLEISEPPVLNLDEETVGSFVAPEIIQEAFNSNLNQFPDIELTIYGAGGEPDVVDSATAVDGQKSLLFSYPGENWGGAYFKIDPPIDFTDYVNGNLVFSVQLPDDLADAEIKLESVSANTSVFLADYNSEAVDNGFVEYTIPLADFPDVDFSEFTIPFSFWNLVDESGAFAPFDVHIDNIYLEQN
jgi:beta-glucanase (GH16 family)